MNHTQMVQELEEVARQLGITLRYEKGDFDGGYCVLRDQKTLVINKKLHDLRKAVILAQALNEIGIDAVFLKPAVREFIEDEAAKILKQK